MEAAETRCGSTWRWCSRPWACTPWTEARPGRKKLKLHQIFKLKTSNLPSTPQNLHQLLENFQGLGVEYGLGKRGRVWRLVVRGSRHGFGKTQFNQNQIFWFRLWVTLVDCLVLMSLLFSPLRHGLGWVQSQPVWAHGETTEIFGDGIEIEEWIMSLWN